MKNKPKLLTAGIIAKAATELLCEGLADYGMVPTRDWGAADGDLREATVTLTLEDKDLSVSLNQFSNEHLVFVVGLFLRLILQDARGRKMVTFVQPELSAEFDAGIVELGKVKLRHIRRFDPARREEVVRFDVLYRFLEPEPAA